MLDTSVIVQYSMDPTTWGEVIHEDVHTHRGAIISCAINSIIKYLSLIGSDISEIKKVKCECEVKTKMSLFFWN